MLHLVINVNDGISGQFLLFAQVNCNKEVVRTYCTDERLLQTAFLFRYIAEVWEMICD